MLGIAGETMACCQFKISHLRSRTWLMHNAEFAARVSIHQCGHWRVIVSWQTCFKLPTDTLPHLDEVFICRSHAVHDPEICSHHPQTVKMTCMGTSRA